MPGAPASGKFIWIQKKKGLAAYKPSSAQLCSGKPKNSTCL